MGYVPNTLHISYAIPIYWAIHLYYLNRDVTEELLITENTYPVIIMCLDDLTNVNNKTFPGPKDTLMVKFLTDRSNLSDPNIKKYVDTIELMVGEDQVIRYSEFVIEKDDEAETINFNEKIVAISSNTLFLPLKFPSETPKLLFQ